MEYFVWIGIVGLLVAILIAWLLALPVLIPPLRSAARRKRAVQGSVTVFTGLISFCLIYMLAAWLLVGLSVGVMAFYRQLASDSSPGMSQEEIGEISEGSHREIWMRQMFPGMGIACYTTAYECEKADKVMTVIVYRSRWEARPGDSMARIIDIPFMAIPALLTMLMNVFFVWRFTRAPKVTAQVSTEQPPAATESDPGG